MIDVSHQLSNVRRARSARASSNPGEARVVTVSQTYPAKPWDVKDACTNIARIPRWFLPISGDLRLHGHYQLDGERVRHDRAVQPAAWVRRDVGVRRQGRAGSRSV